MADFYSTPLPNAHSPKHLVVDSNINVIILTAVIHSPKHLVVDSNINVIILTAVVLVRGQIFTKIYQLYSPEKRPFLTLWWKLYEDTHKKWKGAKTATPHDWPWFHMMQCDWLKGILECFINRNWPFDKKWDLQVWSRSSIPNCSFSVARCPNDQKKIKEVRLCKTFIKYKWKPKVMFFSLGQIGSSGGNCLPIENW